MYTGVFGRGEGGHHWVGLSFGVCRCELAHVRTLEWSIDQRDPEVVLTLRRAGVISPMGRILSIEIRIIDMIADSIGNII